MFVILIIIGGLGVPAVSSSTGWATGALLLILTFSYGMSVEPLEIPNPTLHYVEYF